MARSHVLREISQKKLDPKIIYVKGRDGSLVAKKDIVDRKSFEVENSSLENNDSSDTRKVSEELEVSNDKQDLTTSDAEIPKPKKRFPPPRKKKSSTDEENS